MGLSRRGFLGLGLAGAVAVGAPGLAGCGSSAGGPGGSAELLWRWHGSPSYSERIQEVIKIINGVNPEVRLRGEAISSSGDFYDKLATEVAGGGGPDMFSMVDEQRAAYASRGTLYDFTPHVGKEINVETIPAELLDYFKVDGKLVGLPRTIDCSAAIYDESKFTEIGVAPPTADWSWDSFVDLVTEMGRKIGTGKNYWPTEDGGIDSSPFQSWIQSRGKSLFDGAALGFEKQDLTEWWTYWAELRAADLAPPPDVMSGTKDDLTTFLLVQGKAAFGFGAARHINGLQAVTQSTLNELPHPDGLKAGTPGSSISAGDSVAANAKTAAPERVLAAMDARLNNVEVAKFLGMTAGIPAAGKQIIDQLELTDIDKKVVKTIEAVLAKGGPIRPMAPLGADVVDDNMTLIGEKLAFGQLTMTAAVDQFFSEAEKALAG